MYLDISANQGVIDWAKVAQNKDINGVILRATTQNGKLDTRTKYNYEGILHNMSDVDEISVYKFSYARNYVDARIECMKCRAQLAANNIHYDYFYLDLEGFAGRDHTTKEVDAVILGYMDELRNTGDVVKLRLYFNYNYLKNIVDPVWRGFPIWLARYNSEIGDTFGANIQLWQYTSKGHIDGITKDVDISREVAGEVIVL